MTSKARVSDDPSDRARASGWRRWGLLSIVECDDIGTVYEVTRSSEIFARRGKFNEAIMKARINPEAGYRDRLPLVRALEG